MMSANVHIPRQAPIPTWTATAPVTSSRLAVRGLRASSLRSTMRLKAMANVRADTIATVTRSSEPHCTERTNAPAAVKDWQTLFAHLGLPLEIPAAGCCGMAGTYGHEREHRDMSERLYVLSWARHVNGAENHVPVDRE